MPISNPPIDEAVWSMTDEEYAELLASGWTEESPPAPPLVEPA